jgi:hypothetical protein
MIKDDTIIAVFLVIFAGMVVGALVYNLLTTSVLLQKVIDSITLGIILAWGILYILYVGD